MKFTVEEKGTRQHRPLYVLTISRGGIREFYSLLQKSINEQYPNLEFQTEADEKLPTFTLVPKAGRRVSPFVARFSNRGSGILTDYVADVGNKIAESPTELEYKLLLSDPFPILMGGSRLSNLDVIGYAEIIPRN